MPAMAFFSGQALLDAKLCCDENGRRGLAYPEMNEAKLAAGWVYGTSKRQGMAICPLTNGSQASNMEVSNRKPRARQTRRHSEFHGSPQRNLRRPFQRRRLGAVLWRFMEANGRGPWVRGADGRRLFGLSMHPCAPLGCTARMPQFCRFSWTGGHSLSKMHLAASKQAVAFLTSDILEIFPIQTSCRRHACSYLFERETRRILRPPPPKRRGLDNGDGKEEAEEDEEAEERDRGGGGQDEKPVRARQRARGDVREGGGKEGSRQAPNFARAAEAWRPPSGHRLPGADKAQSSPPPQQAGRLTRRETTQRRREEVGRRTSLETGSLRPRARKGPGARTRAAGQAGRRHRRGPPDRDSRGRRGATQTEPNARRRGPAATAAEPTDSARGQRRPGAPASVPIPEGNW